MSFQKIDRLIKEHKNDKSALIGILQDIQKELNYLPRDALVRIAQGFDIPLSRIYSIVTFYKSFSLIPKGKHIATVCLGTACHVRGGKKIASEFESQLYINAGETTPDKEFTLETVNCVGACALGPVVIVDEQYFPHSTREKVKKIIEKHRGGLRKVDFKTDKRIFPVEVSCPFCNHSLMDQGHSIDGIPSIRVEISYGADRGWVRLSSYYGSYNVESELEVPIGTVVDFFCPHCGDDLAGAMDCFECDATMISMTVLGGGRLEICSRRYCKGHMLDLSNIK